MTTKMQVEWRRAKVLELLSKGDSQSDIAKTLQVDLSIISRDVYFLRQQAKTNIKRYIDERLPEEYEKCLVGLNAITKEAWNTAQNTEDKREKIHVHCEKFYNIYKICIAVAAASPHYFG
ncbi:MAG: hypothetical protein ACJ71M_01225, partial [Nitrososphaeraceae archaeon]